MNDFRPNHRSAAELIPAVFAFAVALTSSLWAQGFPPSEARARMTPAAGFNVALVAHEPMMAQPVCIEFDHRGRLWVVQYLQYPNPAGLKRIKVDRYSRTIYDRVPEPPPRGPRGADRITILEDTNGDGVADRARDFVDGLNLATSVAFGAGGVFVLQPPYLLFYPDRNGHAVQWCELQTWGTTFTAGYGGDLLVANDTWFAPSDMTTGPDGAVYVADWSDQRMSHPDPDAEWDRSNGRVYRIQWTGAKTVSASKSMAALLGGASSLTKLPSSRLTELLAHPNDWFVRKARRVLTERRDPAAYSRLRELVAERGDAQVSLEALWTLYGSGGGDQSYLSALLEHPSPRIRRWAVRFLGDEENVSPATAEALLRLAVSEPDAQVRSQLASTAARLTPAAGLALAQRVALQNRDAKDPFIPMLLWWAVERHCIGALDRTLALYNTPAGWNSELVRRSILPRLVRRCAAEGTSPALQACAALFAGQPLGSDRGPFIAALDQGLRHQASSRRAPKIDQLPPALAKQVLALWDNETRDETLIRLLACLDYSPARNRTVALAADGSNPPALRATMIHAMADPARAEDTDRLLRWFSGTEPDAIKAAALDALQQFDAGPVAAALVGEYPKLGASLRAKVRAALLSRPRGALALLEQIDAKQMAASEVPQAELRPLSQFGDARIDALVRKHWGKIKTTPGEQLAVVRRFNNDLNLARDKTPGDVGRGHTLFQHYCAACHRLYDEGGNIGPDLTAANRKDREFLLISLVDPSAVIRKEFLNYAVKTTDGRVLYGQVIGEAGGTVTLVGANHEKTNFTRDQIVSMEDTGVSLMPEGLLHALTAQQLRDLFSYLQSDGPLP